MDVFVTTRPINGETFAVIGGPMELVTGDAPQPGETPSKESNPWTFSDPDNAFWRGNTDRKPNDPPAAEAGQQRGPVATAQSATLTPPAASAQPTTLAPSAATAQLTTLTPPVEASADHSRPDDAEQAQIAGVQDVTEELVEGGNRPDGVEQDHDQVDDQRFNPTFEYATTTPESQPAEPPVHAAEPEHVPDVMVLPEPSANRPTVALDRGPVPGQPPAGLSRLSPAPPRLSPAPPRLSPAQSRRPSPLLESSPFWLTDAERAERAAAAPEPETRANARDARRRRSRSPRRPATGLSGLVALALIAAFFAWVSAEPFWLAVGHGDTGMATVAWCTGDGVSQRCAGQFRAADGQYEVPRVTLLGVEPGQRDAGSSAPARMVSQHSRQAYVGDAGLLVQLRWLLGFLLVLLCGLGSAALTGTHRLPTATYRRAALILSLTGPLLLLAGFLFVAY